MRGGQIEFALRFMGLLTHLSIQEWKQNLFYTNRSKHEPSYGRWPISPMHFYSSVCTRIQVRCGCLAKRKQLWFSIYLRIVSRGSYYGPPLPRRTWFAQSWITRNLKWPFFIYYQGRLIGLFHLGFWWELFEFQHSISITKPKA